MKWTWSTVSPVLYALVLIFSQPYTDLQEDSLQVLCIMDESSGVAQALLLNTNRDEGLQGAIEAVIAVDPRCLTNHESVGVSHPMRAGALN